MAPVVLFGGLLSGVFTPTEAAAVAVTYALVLGLVVYREFRLADLPRLILDTVETTGVVMALVMTASLLGYCISVSRLPQEFGATLTALTTNPLLYLLIVNVLLLVVGCFMEALAAMLVLIPILLPPALALGIDPVQFGLVFVLNLMIGTITPPVGVVLYVTAKVAGVTLRGHRQVHAAVPGAAARGARDDHAVAAAHDVAAEAAARALSVVVRDNSRRRRRRRSGNHSPHLCRGTGARGTVGHAVPRALRRQCLSPCCAACLRGHPERYVHALRVADAGTDDSRSVRRNRGPVSRTSGHL